MCMDELERHCSVRGYHVYKEIWEASVGEVLVCEREPNNALDRYAVAVKENERLLDICLEKYQECVLCLFDKVVSFLAKLLEIFIRSTTRGTCSSMPTDFYIVTKRYSQAKKDLEGQQYKFYYLT